MRTPTARNLVHRRLIVLGTALLLLVLVALVIYAVATRPSATVSAPPERSEITTPSGASEVVESGAPAALAPLAPADDPYEFARAIAYGLFEWDTTSLVTRADHVEHLVSVADPTGESSPGLVSDLGNYLPTNDMWVQLAEYETRQWLVIESTVTPQEWAVAEAQAGDELAPGTTAATVRGVRHRAGTWEDDPVTSAHDVAFTVFMVCGPSYEQCHLLRLSLLDHPLE